MRLIKMFGLAAVAAVAAMAFVGATSASAAETDLCDVHTALTCSNDAANVSMLGSGELLSDLVDVLCLHIQGAATVLALANPQVLHTTLFDLTGCGTDGDHDNCDVLALTLPLANLNKTGLDAGTFTATSGTTFVECQNIFFGIDISCSYDATGLQFAVGGQHLTATNTQVDFLEGGELCPDESFLHGLLLTTENRYVLA